jgi:hypothetical protein
MYRVELKDVLEKLKNHGYTVFLMYRVELKGYLVMGRS